MLFSLEEQECIWFVDSRVCLETRNAFSQTNFGLGLHLIPIYIATRSQTEWINMHMRLGSSTTTIDLFSIFNGPQHGLNMSRSYYKSDLKYANSVMGILHLYCEVDWNCLV